jgi:drug/metabolite transporter (DMT)-like permease
MIPKGVWMMLIASLAFGFMNVTVKMISGMHVSEIVFFRALVQILISAVFLIQQKQSPWGNNPRLLILRGFFGSMGLLCYFYSLQLMPLSNALVIHYLSPIFTTVLALWLGDEKVHSRQWLFFGVTFFGVLMVNLLTSKVSHELLNGTLQFHHIAGSITPLGLASAFGGAVFSAFAYNTIRRLKGIENPNVVVLYFPLVTIPISLIAPITGLSTWFMPTASQWIWLLLTGIFTQIGQFFMTRAYQESNTGLVSSISYAGIIWGTFFSITLFQETYNFYQFAGMFLVLLGMVLNVFIRDKSVVGSR